MACVRDDILRYASGAVRSSDAEGTRFDLVPLAGWRRLAETCAEGAAKYGDRNWEKGFPASSLMNHALRHLNLWLAGDANEDHLAHAAWNLLALMHFEEQHPELIDVPSRNEER
jgi:hypothetical protein